MPNLAHKSPCLSEFWVLFYISLTKHLFGKIGPMTRLDGSAKSLQLSYWHDPQANVTASCGDPIKHSERRATIEPITAELLCLLPRR
jgi:hypothetical protein